MHPAPPQSPAAAHWSHRSHRLVRVGSPAEASIMAPRSGRWCATRGARASSGSAPEARRRVPDRVTSAVAHVVAGDVVGADLRHQDRLSGTGARSLPDHRLFPPGGAPGKAGAAHQRLKGLPGFGTIGRGPAPGQRSAIVPPPRRAPAASIRPIARCLSGIPLRPRNRRSSRA